MQLEEYRERMRHSHIIFLAASTGIMLRDMDSEPDVVDLTNDVEFLSEARKGKEVITISDEGRDDTHAAHQDSVPVEPFRLMDLPAELRLYIYSYLLPHDVFITFKVDSIRADGRYRWSVCGSGKTADSSSFDIVRSGATKDYYKFNEPCSKRFRPLPYFRAETQLFLINKAISNEARGM